MKNSENSYFHLLIVASSARMLAQVARLAGYLPLVVDLYGDLDTSRYSLESRRVDSLDIHCLTPVLNQYLKKYPVAHAIYGAGLEQYPESLKLIADSFELWGNTPVAFTQSCNKSLFFAILKQYQIPFPEVSFTRPLFKENWLFKPMFGCGGVGIAAATKLDKSDIPGYWQRYQTGKPHSVLFVANGSNAKIIGFNRQWSTELGENGFVFAGVINSTDLDGRQKAQVSRWVARLTLRFCLKGLNSLDFIQHGSELYVLEINPRPPASMQLYDTDLFKFHVAACQGELTERDVIEPVVTGFQIVYAREQLIIPLDFNWPDGVLDIPQPGAIINTHWPICSIIARKKEPESVLHQLNKTQTVIINQLIRLQLHGI